MKELLLNFLLYLNEKNLINNHDFDYEEESKKFIDSIKLNRVECIDETGRAYVNWKADNKIQLSFQDNNRTLKIFITKK